MATDGETTARGALPLALFLILCAVYAPSIGSDFIYDDRTVILDQERPESLEAVARVFGERHFPILPYYRPVTRGSLLLQKHLHGDRAELFHLVNTLLIGLAGVLAFGLLRSPGFAIAPLPAFFGALVFALHPAASSCVYPISSGRETLLPVVLMLLAMFAHLRAGTVSWLVSLAAFGAALFSKEQAVVVPVLFVLADALGLPARPPALTPRSLLLRYWPLIPVCGVYLAVRLWLFAGQELSLAVLEHPIEPLWSLLYALQTIVAPTWELVYEPAAFETWLSAPRVVAAIAVSGLGAMAVRRSDGPLRRAALFWAAWFGLGLLPTANLLEQEAHFSERYVFFSLLGAIAIAASLASHALQHPQRRWAVAAAGLALVTCCGAISFQRGAWFRNELAFFEQWTRTSPGSAIAQYNLGSLYNGAGSFEQAVPHLAEATRLDPNLVGARNNLGLALIRLGRLEDSIQHFERALEIHPDHASAHENLGAVLLKLGRGDAAALHFREALRIAPDSAAAHRKLAASLDAQGDLEAAAVEYRRALVIDPGLAAARLNLSSVLLRQAVQLGDEGGTGQAIERFEEALALDSSRADAANNLAWLLATSADPDHRDGQKALHYARLAVKTAGERHPGLLDTLAAAHAEAGDFEAAQRLAGEAHDLALGAGEDALAEEIRGRQQLYASGRAFHEGEASAE